MTAPRILVVRGGVPCQGTVRTPGEKSISHRAVLFAALAEGTSVIHGLSDGADVAATVAAVEAMGAAVERAGDGSVTIQGGRSLLHQPGAALDCGNSGTSMRLLAGLVAGFDWETELIGDDSLSSRPMDRVAEPLERMGATVSGSGSDCRPPLRVKGGALHGIDWTTRVASAQVKSAILLAGLSAEGPTTVRERVTTRAHTEEMLAEAGVDLTVEPWGEGRIVTIHASALRPVTPRTVPGDPSASAFFVVAGCVVPGSNVEVQGIYQGPARLGYVSVLQRMGAAVTVTSAPDGTATIGATTTAAGPRLRATTVAAAEIPSLDEIPALAVAAAVAEGTTVFSDVGELRVKEVDRLRAVIDMVTAFGAKAEAHGDTLSITGTGTGTAGAHLHGARFDSQGDHRMAMAAAVAGLAAAPGRAEPHHRVRRHRDELPGIRRRPPPPDRDRPARPPGPGRRHRRAGRGGEVDDLGGRGAPPGSRPARYGSDVPLRRRPCVGRGHPTRRSRRRGGPGRRVGDRGRRPGPHQRP